MVRQLWWNLKTKKIKETKQKIARKERKIRLISRWTNECWNKRAKRAGRWYVSQIENVIALLCKKRRWKKIKRIGRMVPRTEVNGIWVHKSTGKGRKVNKTRGIAQLFKKTKRSGRIVHASEGFAIWILSWSSKVKRRKVRKTKGNDRLV